MTQETEVPAAVRRQQESAEARRKAYYEQSQDTPDPGTPGDPTKQPSEPKPPEDPPKPAAEETDWKAKYEELEQRHKTLQGKYGAEVPRLSRELRDAKADNERLREENERLKAAPPAQEPSAGGSTGNAEVDKKLESVREEYGDDLIEVLTGIARKMVNEATQPLTERVESTQKEREQERRERFYADLDDAVPTWQKVNDDPVFHGWLAENDPLTGKQRQAALEEAYRNLDAQRVAAIFNRFIEEQGPKPGSGDTKASDSSLESQVTPESKGGTPPPNEGADQKVYTSADMAQLRKDGREGRITDAEFNRRMQEIQKAIGEGRYRPS